VCIGQAYFRHVVNDRRIHGIDMHLEAPNENVDATSSTRGRCGGFLGSVELHLIHQDLRRRATPHVTAPSTDHKIRLQGSGT
jgi:hypothetical protein